MKTLATLGLALALAVPATAQVMGSTNRNAPTMTHIMAFHEGPTVTVKYTAITWAQGKWAKNLGQMREFLNSRAAQSPMGELHADGNIQLGGKDVASGKYKVFFTLTEDLNWVLNLQDLKGEGKPISWELKLKETEAQQTRLAMGLKPTKNAKVGHMQLAFGPMGTEVPFMAAQNSDKSE